MAGASAAPPAPGLTSSPTQAAAVLQSGVVMGVKLQPHESHIPYLLQMMVDHNLRGMEHVRVAKVKFRPAVPVTSKPASHGLIQRFCLAHHGQGRVEPPSEPQGTPRVTGRVEPPSEPQGTPRVTGRVEPPSEPQASHSPAKSPGIPSAAASLSKSDSGTPASPTASPAMPGGSPGAAGYMSVWTAASIPTSWRWGVQGRAPARQTKCELEADAEINDVQNRQDVLRLPLDQASPEVQLVQSLAPLWEEERLRSGGSTPSQAPSSPPRQLPEPGIVEMHHRQVLLQLAAADRVRPAALLQELVDALAVRPRRAAALGKRTAASHTGAALADRLLVPSSMFRTATTLFLLSTLAPASGVRFCHPVLTTAIMLPGPHLFAHLGIAPWTRQATVSKAACSLQGERDEHEGTQPKSCDSPASADSALLQATQAANSWEHAGGTPLERRDVATADSTRPLKSLQYSDADGEEAAAAAAVDEQLLAQSLSQPMTQSKQEKEMHQLLEWLGQGCTQPRPSLRPGAQESNGGELSQEMCELLAWMQAGGSGESQRRLSLAADAPGAEEEELVEWEEAEAPEGPHAEMFRASRLSTHGPAASLVEYLRASQEEVEVSALSA
ncbi:hypothetical protein CYMTET_32486, partial [Cymbomonas tetramitiformis]